MSVPAKQPTAIQLRRGTSAYWTSIDVAPGYFKPRNGEPIYETDTGKVKIGDGNTRYINLDYLADTANLNINDLSDVTIASPQNDQGIIYEGGVWKNKTVIAAASVAKTKPSPATDGALWFDPEDARLYRYYDDGTGTPQWVEINQTIAQQSNTFTSGVTIGGTLSVTGTTTLGTANITTANLTNPLTVANGGTGATTGAGIVPIVPTSVNAGSGTYTVSSNGLISFTSATIFQALCFSSQYSNYRIILDIQGVSSADYIYWRGVLSNGSAYTTGVYYTGSVYQQSGTVAAYDNGGIAVSYSRVGYASTDDSNHLIMDIQNPFPNNRKTKALFVSQYSATSVTNLSGAVTVDTGTSFSGIRFGPVTSGTWTGTMRVFGVL